VSIDVRNPRTGEIDFRIEAMDAAAIAAEAARLRAGQPGWQALGADARARHLSNWADIIEAQAASIIAPLSIDTGRRQIARMEVAGIVGSLRRWATTGPGIIAGLDDPGRPSATPGVTILRRAVPYPLLGVIAPWNFPLLLSLVDAIPALMAGAAVMVKPSEVTPRFVPALRATLAGLPELDSVVSLVTGDAVTGRAIVECVDYVCFTGSVATGRKVAEAAARAFVPANLELGGKDPMIVLPSADPVRAARIALRASVLATGQACQSIERIYVARSLSAAFIDALVSEARKVPLSYPDPGQGILGPFIFPAQADKVARQIEDAVRKGATVLTGGEVETLGGGKYLRPTVLTDVTPDMAIMAEETFGPVLPIAVYDTVEEAIGLANDSVYGLSAAVIGDAEEAVAVGQRLQAGAISINDGAMTASVWDAENESFKLSGMGPSRMGDRGLTRFFRIQAIIRQDGEPAVISDFSERG
jgi:acyl-CoA reductase-like NAD-dependent aldehyde dehydrogenase